MHPNPRRIIPVVIVLALIAVGWWYFGGRASAQSAAIDASGTIEATDITVATELAGRVLAVNVGEGDAVTAGQILVVLDPSLLQAQRAQAEAVHAAATSAAQAAEANVALLQNNPTPEQLAIAQTVVDKAQIAVDALQESYDDLSESAKDSASGKALKQQLDTALATLANARAQYDAVAAGASDQQLEAAQAQAAAAQAQAAAARAALNVIDVQLSKLTITAPADGTVLARAVEPGEVVLPGAALINIANLSRLTITVYVPEDRYGKIELGQTATVMVDSYPGEAFTATVQRIADKAEFTPRNVQTADGRKTTVYAVKLMVDNVGGKLKPGMPADVVFDR